MSVKEEELADLQAELTAVETTITNILNGGQAFQKGGRTGFMVQQAKLQSLYEKKRELKNKIATWGMADDI